MLTLKQFIIESEEKIHKKPEITKDGDEKSIEKGATIVTSSHVPGRYKQYKVYGFEDKSGIHHSSKPAAYITHHHHDLKKGDPGFVSSDENERMKKEGRFRVTHTEHSMSDKKVTNFFKTGSAAKKYAIEHAKKIQAQRVGDAKAASSFGYTGKHYSVSRNTQK